MTPMTLTFLGTGTSTGVPQIGCDCPVCRSSEPADKRLRTSALLNIDGHSILIDCGPDFREQMLRLGSPDIDTLLVTHSHYDHVGGVDDLRPYTYVKPTGFPIYCTADVDKDLRTRVPYAFITEHHYPGAPVFTTRLIEPGKSFKVADGIEVLPLSVMHGKLPIVGFRIGRFAYITDCSSLPAATIEALQGVEVLVINALRKKPHPSHMNLDEALSVIRDVKPRQAYLTHLSHDMGLHADVAPTLPAGVEIATDGLTVNL